MSRRVACALIALAVSLGVQVAAESAAVPATSQPPAAPESTVPTSAATPQAVTPPAPPTPPPRVYATTRVTLQTTLGNIALDIERERAPVTAANFLRYVREKRLDGMAFYRAMTVAPGYGLIQGGTSNDRKRTLPPIRHEATSSTGLSHLNGAISMARGNPGTASGDWFIVIGDLVSLDADLSKPGDNLGYAVFGKVVNGMDVVHRILAAPISQTKGEGAMRGQMIEAPIKIVAARIGG